MHFADCSMQILLWHAHSCPLDGINRPAMLKLRSDIPRTETPDRLPSADHGRDDQGLSPTTPRASNVSAKCVPKYGSHHERSG